MLYHIPQLRSLDGVEIAPEEKVKAENLHGVDLNDREKIFKAMLPQEQFVDRRIATYDDIEEESEDDIQFEEKLPTTNSVLHKSVIESEIARQYVGELFTRLDDQK